MDENDTPTTQDGTQNDAASGQPDAAAEASQAGDEDVSVLRSRYAGQTAKVNELTGQKTALETQIQALQKQLKDAQGGITSADEAAKALLAAKDEEIAQLQRSNKVTALQARFPEVFAELGEDAVSLTEEKLAAMEARLQGGAGAGSDEPPTPRGQNAARKDGVPTGGREPKEASSDDILAHMRTMALPAEWGGNS